MKKTIALILAMCLLLAMSAAGCKSGDPSAAINTNAAGQDTSVPQESSGSESTAPSESTATTPSETEATEEPASFEEITVVDNDACAIRITELDPNSRRGCTLKVNLENKSTDKTYMFSVAGASVNGVQTDPFFASEVAPGKKSVDSISFSDDVLKDNGIDFTDIELIFRAYDSDDWSADDVARETVHVYPYGEDRAELFERTPQSTDNVIVDNEYVTATVIGYEKDDFGYYEVLLFLQNKTDAEVMFSVDEASVNGFMVDPFWATSVLPGKCAFDSISWSHRSLEESGITEVEEIEFLFRAYDYNDWTADDFTNETITLHP